MAYVGDRVVGLSVVGVAVLGVAVLHATDGSLLKPCVAPRAPNCPANPHLGAAVEGAAVLGVTADGVAVVGAGVLYEDVSPHTSMRAYDVEGDALGSPAEPPTVYILEDMTSNPNQSRMVGMGVLVSHVSVDGVYISKMSDSPPSEGEPG